MSEGGAAAVAGVLPGGEHARGQHILIASPDDVTYAHRGLAPALADVEDIRKKGAGGHVEPCDFVVAGHSSPDFLQHAEEPVPPPLECCADATGSWSPLDFL